MPNTASAPSPSNLFTQPWCSSTTSTAAVKNWFRIATTSVGGRVAASSVEATRSTKSTAASRTSPPRRLGAGERLLGDVGADVASEEVAEALSFAQPDDHAVEPALELTDLGGVVQRDRGVEVTALDRRDRFAQVTNGIEHGLDRDAVEQPPDQQCRRADDEDGHRELGRGRIVAGER